MKNSRTPKPSFVWCIRCIAENNRGFTHITARDRLLTIMCIILAGLVCVSKSVNALTIPADPSQSIVYWKPHIIPDDNSQVAQVKSIFNILLRTWNGAQIAPAVHVVQSTTGPWAASLADGNILLSQDTIDICHSFGPDRAEHLLAFVLSHELAHQRSNDLWHQKFFRLIGTKSQETQRKLLRGFDANETFAGISDIEQKEAQADHDALVIMSSVGFDPYQIIDKKDFFTTWAEQLWQSSCEGLNQNDAMLPACLQAKTRALRTRTQLETTAAKTTIYTLALQAFVAGDYQKARHLFEVYGRELPSRAVYVGVGLSYLAEAIELKQSATELKFYYPIILATNPESTPQNQSQKKRGNTNLATKQNKEKIHKLSALAIQFFEKSIKLEPQHRRPYLLLALAYLIDENTFMARGILQGQYKPQFGSEPAMQLILAMTTAVEGNFPSAQQQFQSIIGKLPKERLVDSPLPYTLLQYTANYNLSVLISGEPGVKQLWKKVASQAQADGNSLLFRMALTHLSSTITDKLAFNKHPNIMSYQIGDQFTSSKRAGSEIQSEMWIDGEKQLIYRIPKIGVRLVVDNQQRILSLWQHAAKKAELGRLKIGDSTDRTHKIIGMPDRELFFTQGTYLAYDRYGIGIHIVDNKIAGWFLYQKS